MENLQEDRQNAGAPPSDLRQRAEAMVGSSRERKADLLGHDFSKLIQELNIYHVELEIQNNDLQQISRELEKSHAFLRSLFMFAPVGFVLLSAQDDIVRDINESSAKLFVLPREILIGQRFQSFISEQSFARYYALRKTLMASGQPQSCEVFFRVSPELRFWAILNMRLMAPVDGEETVILCSLVDITTEKSMSEELRMSSEKLEQMVRDRTLALAKTSQVNDKLVLEIKEREQIESALRESEAALKEKSRNLAEANTALSVLLRKREQDKQEAEKRCLSNMAKFISPYLAKLRQSGLSDHQQALADILEANIKELFAPLSGNANTFQLELTPTEMQVANLIRQGKSSKEIATLLHLATATIEVHRKKIRKKAGLTNKKSNLHTALTTLF